MNIAVCIACNQPIIGKRKDAVYCSVSCGNRHRNKKYYNNNPDKFSLKRVSERFKFESWCLARIKSKCKKNNTPFNLTIEDIVAPEYCPVLGIKLGYNFGRGSGFHPDSPSVDRIIPSLGYIKGNVRVISARANLLKSDASVEELEKVLDDLKRIRDEHK